MLFLLFPSVGSQHVLRPLQLGRSRPVLPVACWAAALAQPALCAQANVQAYPTWEIKGQVYRGGMSLEELASISGYKP